MAWYSAVANRGYVAQGREKLVVLEETGTEAELRKTVPDLKESLEIGRDDQPETPNMWPSGDDDAKVFKENMLQFFETCKGLHIQVMRAIALGMGAGSMASRTQATTRCGSCTTPACPSRSSRGPTDRSRSGLVSTATTVRLLILCIT
jgi:isopenicillin N synthase-like dioxygenase